MSTQKILGDIITEIEKGFPEFQSLSPIARNYVAKLPEKYESVQTLAKIRNVGTCIIHLVDEEIKHGNQ